MLHYIADQVAAFFGDLATLRILLDAGADVNAKNGSGQTVKTILKTLHNTDLNSILAYRATNDAEEVKNDVFAVEPLISVADQEFLDAVQENLNTFNIFWERVAPQCPSLN